MITTIRGSLFERALVRRDRVALGSSAPQSCLENSPLVLSSRKLKVDFPGNIRRRNWKEVGKIVLALRSYAFPRDG